jgi:hypothetical protein
VYGVLGPAMIGQDKAAAHKGGTHRVQSLKGCESGMEEETSRGGKTHIDTSMGHTPARDSETCMET